MLEQVHARNPILVRESLETTPRSQAEETRLSLTLQSTIAHFVAEARETDAYVSTNRPVVTSGQKALSTRLYPGAAASAESVCHCRSFQMLSHATVDDTGVLAAEIDDQTLADLGL